MMTQNKSTRILVVSAHTADFVWRAAGTIANFMASGSRVRILVLSYGKGGNPTFL